MPYIINNEEVSRAEFHSRLQLDIADPETGHIDKLEWDDAMQQLIDGNEFAVGPTKDTMNKYQITKGNN